MYKIIHQKEPKGDILEAILELYEKSFPPEEKRDVNEFLGLCKSQKYALFTLEIEGSFAGFALYFISKKTPFYLLEYVAVEPLKQGKGSGSFLLLNSQKSLFEIYGNAPILAEVEALDAKDPIREKRQAFYFKLGYADLCPYILPLHGNINSNMRLFTYNNTQNLDAMACMRLIYEEIYFCEPKQIDKLIKELLKLGVPNAYSF